LSESAARSFREAAGAQPRSLAQENSSIASSHRDDAPGCPRIDDRDLVRPLGAPCRAAYRELHASTTFQLNCAL